jgi:hypothetical protein
MIMIEKKEHGTIMKIIAEKGNLLGIEIIPNVIRCNRALITYDESINIQDIHIN